MSIYLTFTKNVKNGTRHQFFTETYLWNKDYVGLQPGRSPFFPDPKDAQSSNIKQRFSLLNVLSLFACKDLSWQFNLFFSATFLPTDEDLTFFSGNPSFQQKRIQQPKMRRKNHLQFLTVKCDGPNTWPYVPLEQLTHHTFPF